MMIITNCNNNVTTYNIFSDFETELFFVNKDWAGRKTVGESGSSQSQLISLITHFQIARLIRALEKYKTSPPHLACGSSRNHVIDPPYKNDAHNSKIAAVVQHGCCAADAAG